MKAVVFDMDGLMIDSEKIYWEVGRQIAREHGKEVSDQTLGRMMGRSPLESMVLFCQEVGLSDPPGKVYELREQRVFECLQKGVDPMPGLPEVLVDLKRDHKLGIATSASMRFVEVILRHLQLAGVFDAVQTSDDIHRGKPDPEIYQRAMGRLDVQPADCVVLEDSSNGALAAKRAGAYVIAVPSQYTREQDFSFADEQADDLKDALRRIRGMELPADPDTRAALGHR